MSQRSFIDRFLHADRLRAEPEVVRKSRTLAAMALSLLGTVVVVFALLLLLPDSPTELTPICAIAFVGYASVMWLLRYTRVSLTTASGLLGLILAAALTFVAMHKGEEAMVGSAWNVAVILLFTYMAGPRGAVAITLVMIAQVWLVPLLVHNGISMPPLPTTVAQPKSMFAAGLMGMSFAVVGLLTWLQVSSLSNAHRALLSANQVIARKELNLSTLLESTDDLIAYVGIDRKIVTMNSAFSFAHHAIFGKTAARFGTFLSDADDETAKRWREYVRLAETGTPTTTEEVVRWSTLPRRLSISIRPIVESTGATVGTSFFARDVTAQRQMETDLQQSQKLESVGRLAAGVAHEINTPIQFISDSVHFLRDGSGELVAAVDKFDALLERAGDVPALRVTFDELKEEIDFDYLKEHLPKACERTLDGIKRVSTIVRSMREFAHPDSQQMSEADLNHAIESTLTISRNEYKYVADIVTELGEIPKVMCNVGEINQAVLNMVVNAAHAIGDLVKGTENRGTITVRTALKDDMVNVSISDTGTGIPPAVVEHIFDPFFTTKEVGRGTGQGLAIARSVVVQKHHGKLTVSTKLGEGTTFTMCLPVTQVAEPARAA